MASLDKNALFGVHVDFPGASHGIENYFSLDSLFLEENIKNKESGKSYYKKKINNKRDSIVFGPMGKKSRRPIKRVLGVSVVEGGILIEDLIESISQPSFFNPLSKQKIGKRAFSSSKGSEGKVILEEADSFFGWVVLCCESTTGSNVRVCKMRC